MDLTNVILKPLLTEKSYMASQSDPRKYTFKVNPKASKTLISLAFKAIYGITPASVNTITKKPARTKTGTAKPGYTRLLKIAIITLDPGVQIAVTGEKPEETKKDSSKEEKKEAKE